MNRRRIKPLYGEMTAFDWLWLAVFFIVLVLVISIIQDQEAHGALIDQAQGPHASMFQLQVEPAAGTATVQPETGVVIRRITDGEALKIKYPNIKISTGVNYAGLENGYSRFECVAPDQKSVLAFGTTPYAILHDLTTFKDLHFIASKSVNVGKVGDLQELKWNPADGKLYYASGHCEYRQDPVTGAEEQVYDFGKNYFHTSDGSFSNDGRILAMALIDGYTTKGVTIVNDVVVIDVVARKEICRVRYGKQPAGVDVSGDGKFLKIDNFFYDIPSGAYRNHNEAGHGGWAGGWFVNQNSKTDWIEAFDPATSQTLFLMRMGAWAGMHAASDKRGYFPGHSLISTYKSSDSDPLGNNVFFLELKSQKPSCSVHPSNFKGTAAQAAAYSKLWNSQNAPLQCVRVCAMQHLYQSQQYFTEGWASVGADHCVYWGGNWHGTDNLELYRAELPADVLAAAGASVQPVGGKTVELYAGCNVPQWGISDYPIGPDGFQGNYMPCKYNGTGTSTRGNLTILSAGRTDTFVFNGLTYTSKTLFQNTFNTGLAYYFNLKKVPKNIQIKHAYLDLYTTATQADAPNHPTGAERIPIPRIINPKGWPAIWTVAHLIPGATNSKEESWNGASFSYWKEEFTGNYDSIGRPVYSRSPWGDVVAPSPHAVYGTGYGRYGNLVYNAIAEIPGQPEMSFNPDVRNPSRSSDLRDLVQGWADGLIPNWGIYLDADHARGTQYFNDSKGRPTGICFVSVVNPYQGNPLKSPKLVIEFE